ncbi:MAG: SpoIIE family protein phosphatase [Roseiflexus sp.]|nr:SpoIIE family protein phosphatase [Roseiflexus sp.]MCS7287500.1 SpoIIE family protein phosphatase [Roseiflexus sp.]MDW8231356.1 SpoIIE family protein phosphatase [Roseiflexaceae bacterium]
MKNREQWLILYCLVMGAVGWAALILSSPGAAPWSIVALFVILALLIEAAAFRVPPADPHSLSGIVILSAALALGPVDGALVAGVSGLIFGVLLPLIYRRPRTFYLLAARPLLRSGVRAGAVLAGGALARLLAGNAPLETLSLITLILCYPTLIQLNRAIREYIQGGMTGVLTWWQSSWMPMVAAEIAPLPLAALFAAIYTRLGTGYFVFAAAGLLAASLAVRQSALHLRNQGASIRELRLLNEASREIIRAELDVEELSELIYRAASKVVDTSSFHLGLFDPESDRYTLVVRVQDRVRLPPLTVDLASGDGLIGWMRQTGRSLLVEDFTAEMDRLPARPRYQSERPPRSGIYVPLLDGGKVIGTISIQSYQPYAFDADDLRMLSLLADQAAVAISKARAFAAANERAVQLQAIQEVSERITAILDLDQLLPSVVRLIRERFGYHTVHIFLLEEDGRLHFSASTVEGEALERLRRVVVNPGEGIVGSAALSGQPLLVNDVRADPRYISDDSSTRAELAVPLRSAEKVIGVLDIQSTEAGRFQSSDLFITRTLADQVAIAVKSARAFQAQREEAWMLNALLQVAENLSRATSLDTLLPAVVRLPPLLLGCDRCYCLIWDRPAASFTPLAAYGLRPAERDAFVGCPINERDAPLLTEVVHTVAPLALDSARGHSHLCAPIIERFGSASLLATPLWTRGAALGALVLDYGPSPHQFTARDLTLANGFAAQIAGALESALLAQEAAQAARLEEELRVARDIQRTLLPSRAPDLPGWDTAADWRSARMVGGDFFDYWRLPAWPAVEQQSGRDGQLSEDGAACQPLGFVIADVSDKGVPAALFMALARSLVRAAALDGSAPSVALTRANRWITRDTEAGMFVTVFYGIIEPHTGRMRYCCAGHNPPLLFRANGAVETLHTPGIALGVLEEITLTECEVSIAVGDVVVCYTDGVTEAINAADEPFGIERLIDTVAAVRTGSAQTILEAVTETLSRYAEGPLYDDVTLVIIKRVE